MLIVFVRPSSGNNIFLPLLRWTAVGRVHLSSCSLSGVAPFWTWTNSRAVSARRRKLEILHAPTDESATNCGAAATALLFKLSSIIRETVVTFERPMQFRFFFSSQWILWHCDIILCDCSSLAAACNGLEMQLHDACTLQFSMLWINKIFYFRSTESSLCDNALCGRPLPPTHHSLSESLYLSRDILQPQICITSRPNAVCRLVVVPSMNFAYSPTSPAKRRNCISISFWSAVFILR